MKRLIVILSVALMAGCALALAEDTAPTANTDAMNNSGQDVGNTVDQTTTTVKKTAKTAKTCTDDNGNVLKKGEAGFKTCWNAQHPKQESGMAAKQQNENNQNKMESNTDHANPNGDNSMSNPSGTNDQSQPSNQNSNY